MFSPVAKWANACALQSSRHRLLIQPDPDPIDPKIPYTCFHVLSVASICDFRVQYLEPIMLDAVVGAVIMVVATTSLLLVVEVNEDAFRTAGKYPVNDDERVLLDSLARSLREKERDSASAVELIDDVEGKVIDQLPRQYQ